MATKIDLQIVSKDKCVPCSSESKPYYPSFYVDKELPFDGKDVGKIIIAKVKIKLTSYSERNEEKKQSCSYNFDVMGMEVISNAKDAVKEVLERDK
jgi:hypothetical protein